MTIQIHDLKHLSLPPGWDGDELLRLSLVDGTTYEDVVSDIEAALGIAEENVGKSYLANLTYNSDVTELEYPSGQTVGFERATERALGGGRRASTVGHMLPLTDWDYQFYWTQKFLKQARRSQIDADIDALIQNAEELSYQQTLTRLFKMEEETGNYYGLGTGTSVPFCDGGAGAIAYTPRKNAARGKSFLATHDHYLRLNGITQVILDQAVDHLWEHGIDGPYELIIAEADITAWTTVANVTGYVERPDPSVMYGGASENLANVGDMYIGGVKCKNGFCHLYASGRIPTTYWAVTKSYGANDPNNPLAIRGSFTPGVNVSLVGAYPLQGATPIVEFGVGVGRSREAAVLVRNDTTGDYTTPTIT